MSKEKPTIEEYLTGAAAEIAGVVKWRRTPSKGEPPTNFRVRVNTGDHADDDYVVIVKVKPKGGEVIKR